MGASYPDPIAAGGTLAEDASYYYHTFKANGSLTFLGPAYGVEIIAVGGGGSGGTGTFAGGGGAGGAALFTGYVNYGGPTQGDKTWTIVIGSGGAPGSNGTKTYINAYADGPGIYEMLFADGGGRGGNSYAWNDTDAGQNGGCGGGGASVYGNYDTRSPGQALWTNYGANGGTGMNFTSGAYSAGGGGGNGGDYLNPAVGKDGTRSKAGDGGIGAIFNDWGNATNTGELGPDLWRYYGGGGGGGLLLESGAAITKGFGGLGGGGDGRYQANSGVGNTNPENGMTNTGGGGGGGSSTSPTTVGAGGSGLVIVRYLKGIYY